MFYLRTVSTMLLHLPRPTVVNTLLPPFFQLRSAIILRVHERVTEKYPGNRSRVPRDFFAGTCHSRRVPIARVAVVGPNLGGHPLVAGTRHGTALLIVSPH